MLVRLISLVFIILSSFVGLHTVSAGSSQISDCDGFKCGLGEECFLKEQKCKHHPCPAFPYCRDKCDFIICAPGSFCLFGKCMPDCHGHHCTHVHNHKGCDSISCRPGFSCIHGGCYPKDCNGHYCPFGQECFMKETNCKHFPCPKVPHCRDWCDSVQCNSGFTCFYGKCVPDCRGHSCNKFLDDCKGDYCKYDGHDNCHNIKCPHGFICLHGKCVSLLDDCTGHGCKHFLGNCGGEHCKHFDHRFNHNCKGEHCYHLDHHTNHDCKGERCRHLDRHTNHDCKGEHCRHLDHHNDNACKGDNCHDYDYGCNDIKCPHGFNCFYGKCTPKSCHEHLCKHGEECYLKEINCKHSHCPKVPFCRPSCSSIQCPHGYICLSGQCIMAPVCDKLSCNAHEECSFLEAECLTRPCPKIPVCLPKVKQLPVCNGACPKNHYCSNGHCNPYPTCKNHHCGHGDECFLQTVNCLVPPCYPIPVCRKKIPLCLCGDGSTCKHGKCAPKPSCGKCGAGHHCFTENSHCHGHHCPTPHSFCKPNCPGPFCYHR